MVGTFAQRPVATGLQPCLLIDGYMPDFDAIARAHRVVDAEAQTVWGILRDFDLMQVRSPLINGMFALRGLPERLRRGRQPAIRRLRLDDGLPGWLQLGEEPGREVAFGAVGVFWTGQIEWLEVPLEDFAAFNEPGFGKIAANFTVQPYGMDRALLSYECRTVATDPVSRHRFLRYWFVVRPFVGHLMRATVAAVARDAERAEAV